MEDAGMNTSIFIRSYAPDFQWLSFCLRSIHKFASGFKEVVIAVPEGHEQGLKHLTVERVMTVHDGQPGYLCQQSDKMHADLHARSDFCLHVDSDCTFHTQCTPETFMREGKPIWMWTPWADLSGDEKKSWFAVMCKAIQECPSGEMMRRHPQLIPVWAYGAFREFMQKLHGITLTEYIMSQPKHEYSEFNVLGFYLYLHHRDKFFWWNTSEMGVPPTVLDQAWSHEPMTDETRRKLTAALA